MEEGRGCSSLHLGEFPDHKNECEGGREGGGGMHPFSWGREEGGLNVLLTCVMCDDDVSARSSWATGGGT